jgi:ActR/RegA family two-component response regulator
MPPQALILSRDEEMNVIFKRVLESMGIAAQSEERTVNALQLLAKNKYDVVVVDHDDIGDAQEVLVAVRNGKSNKNAIVFAVLNGMTLTSEAYQSGANFSLDKPLTMEQVARSLRAAQGLIVTERRRYTRYVLSGPVFVQELTDPTEMQGVLINISEGGVALRLPWKRTKKEPSVRVRFLLPESTVMIVGTADVMWGKDTGEMGIRFTQLTKASRLELEEWLQQKWRQQEATAFPTWGTGNP